LIARVTGALERVSDIDCTCDRCFRTCLWHWLHVWQVL